MSIDDVLGRIQQLQALVDPQTSVPATTAATTGNGQDFSSMLATATGSPATAAATTTATPAGSAYGTLQAMLPTTTAIAPLTGSTSPATTAVPTTAFPTTAFPTTGNDVVSDSIQYLGVPYKWGGTDPSTGLDCSGLVQRVYADKGVSLPRTSAEQATAGTEVAGGVANAQPGDLVFFGSPVHHVGIYAGNNMMVEAPHTGTKVQVHSIDAMPTHVRRIGLTAPTAGTAIPAVTGTVGVPATTAGSAASTLATLGAEDPTAAMDKLGVPASLRSVFTTAAQSQGLPVSLLAAVAKVESGYDLTSLSSAGAQGLMQLMPNTAAGLGANPWDPTSAATGAAKLLRGYIDKYGSVPLALAAYNAGPGAVQKYGGIPPYAETQAYVQRVGALAAAA